MRQSIYIITIGPKPGYGLAEARHWAAWPVCGTEAEMEKRAAENWLSFLSVAFNYFRRALFSKMVPKI